MGRPRKIENTFNAANQDRQFTEGQKSKGILDDYAVRGDVATKEGTIQHTPTAAKHITNKEYVDTNNPTHTHSLDVIANPEASKTFNLGNNKFINWTSVDRTPVADEGIFNWECSGNFTGDLCHIHQHTGNAGVGTNLLRIESEDSDAKCLSIEANAATDTALCVETGRVGIGTTAPLRNLHVSSAGDNTELLVSSWVADVTDATSSIGFKTLANAGDVFHKNAIISHRPSTYPWGKADLHFAVDIAGDTGNAVLADSKMMIDGVAGNVGIGTDAPGYPLHVKTSGANASLVVERAGGVQNFINATTTFGQFGTVNDFPVRINVSGAWKFKIDGDPKYTLRNTTDPTPATYTGGGIIFVSGGALWWKGSSGTYTNLAVP